MGAILGSIMADDFGHSSLIPAKSGIQLQAKAKNYTRLRADERKLIQAFRSAP